MLTTNDKGLPYGNVLGKRPSGHRLAVTTSAVDQNHGRIRQQVRNQVGPLKVLLEQFAHRHGVTLRLMLDLVDVHLLQLHCIPHPSLVRDLVKLVLLLSRIFQLERLSHGFDDNTKSRQIFTRCNRLKFCNNFAKVFA